MNKWLKDNINEDNILKGRDNSNIRDYYCHLIPQYEYIYDDNGERTCDTILNFDNLNEDFNNLMKAKNIDLRLDDKTKENKSHFNLTVDDININGKVVTMTYFTGAGLSLFSPPPLVSRKKEGLNNIKVHKILANIHIPAMILTNVLSDEDKKAHRTAAYTAFASYSFAMLSIIIDF